MATIKPGIYQGRGIKGTAQYGLSEKLEPQVAVDVGIPELDGLVITVALSFHPNAMPYSIQRLRAMGWTGKNVLQLDGIDKESIDVQLFFDTYQGRQRLKAEIMTGGGTFKLDRQLEDSDRERLANEVLRFLEAQDREMNRDTTQKRR